MITCEYIGRLGNNMFQIAAAASLAKKNKDIFDGENWKYKDIFEFDDNVIFSGKNNNFKKISQEGFGYSEISYEKNSQLYGYFQSEKYFEKNYVKKIFTLKDKYREYALNKYKDLLSDQTISLHIRRTDYLQLQNQHPVQPESYFREAISLIKSKENLNYKILVFSDDIEYCKKTFIGDEFVFIEGEPDFVDMYLMSQCRHNVISNSSFSWWGAWLGEVQETIVVAPKNWFGPHYAHLETKDIYAERWIVL